MARIYIRISKGMPLLPLSGFSITPCLFIFEPLPTVYYNNAEFVGRRGGGRGGGGATTTLNFTSKLNPAEVKWRHGSFVRAFRFEPWYYRGGKRSNNIISINRFPRRVNYWTVRINRDLRRGEEEEEEEGNV